MKRRLEHLDRQMLADNCRFVAEAWRRFPDAPDPSEPVAAPDPEALGSDPVAALRRYRQLASIHILWQDLSGSHDMPATGQAISVLATDCLQIGLRVAEARVAERFGELLDGDGRPQQLAILGLGKLGGNELNFNSDIDIVFAHNGVGRSTGRRSIDAAEWHKRVARELIAMLEQVTAQGRVWIVDTRLRPFGESGALVWSATAMEQYFVSEGRAWERYAWLKARCVAGDMETGQRLVRALEPFVFRRYLDYGIFDSLRELHQRIDAGSRRQCDDIKRGAGGIRELEFLVQSLQILRGGREPSLRVQGFLPALHACTGLGLIAAEDAGELENAYCFLRILENRLQALTARQGHELPDEPDDRARLALLMAHEKWAGVEAELDGHRGIVRRHFSERFREPAPQASGQEPLWPPDDQLATRLAEAGFESAEPAADSLLRLKQSLDRKPLSAEGRKRLDRLMPVLLEQVCKHPAPDTGLPELLRLIEQISRRSAYLALLHERPETLARLVRVFRLSQRVSEWIIQSPQLLDDLLDPVHGLELPAPPVPDPSDQEASLWALGRWRQAGFLRTALAELDDRMSPRQAGRQLAGIAATLLDRVLEMTGRPEDLAVIAFGNFGAEQLHYGSDLDLVFLHREGDPPMRAVQRLISAMQMPLPGGRLFEIDTRLRPNGRAGLLVSTLASFDDYQHTRAWTWEHQALIRARWVAGDASFREDFDQVRRSVLTTRRDADAVAGDLARMRQRQRNERNESDIRRLLTDLQFIAELGVLTTAPEQPAILAHRTTGEQLGALAASGWLDEQPAESLIEAWLHLLRCRHHGWLRRSFEVGDIDALGEEIGNAWSERFGPDPNP